MLLYTGVEHGGEYIAEARTIGIREGNATLNGSPITDGHTFDEVGYYKLEIELDGKIYKANFAFLLES